MKNNKEYDYDIAIIMKKVFFDVEEGIIGFIPEKVVEGFFDEEEICFVDFEGTPYFHIIDKPESYGFYGRLPYASLKSKLPRVTDSKIKNEMLKKAKKSNYIYIDENMSEISVPMICEFDEEKEELKQILDGDMVTYYYKNYNDYFYKYIYKDESNISLENPEKKDNSISTEKFDDISVLYNEIKEHVIGQDKAIKEILEVIFDQYEKDEDEKICNILINGDTGVGKTEIFRVLTKCLDVPLVMTAATQYSATGYVGSSIEDMLVSLLRKADGDLEKAQKGILIIDEIDKLSEANKSNTQVNKTDVQNALLKVLEDGIVPITYGEQNVDFDTSRLIVVGMGSWTGIDLEPEKTLGFGKITPKKKTYKDVSSKDMVDNGMSRDFIGRFDVIIQMNNLTNDNYIEILKSKQNILEKHKGRLEKKGVTLEITDDLLKAIADKAINSQFGARDLRKIVEKSLVLAKFDIRSHPGMYSKIIIDKDTLEDNEKYTLVKRIDS